MKTTKRVLITLMFGLSVMSLMAQADVVATGGTAIGGGGSATYTVGQIATQRLDNGDKFLIEGVQQPYEIQSTGVNNYPDITLNAYVYPNPTQHYVQLHISNYEIPATGLKAQLYDDNGKLLRIFTISDFDTHIDMERYPTATYQLRVMDNALLLKTFKIVKHNF